MADGGASIQAQAGRSFQLWIGNGASPEVYTLVSGLRTNDITINGNPVDITNKSSAGWQELLAGAGVRSCDLTAQGIFDKNVLGAHTTMEAAALAGGSLLPFKVLSAAGDAFIGYWAVATYKRTGPYDNAETFDVTLKSHGPILHI
jgi:predicted secreted protein